jgi:hypothetical protein
MICGFSTLFLAEHSFFGMAGIHNDMNVLNSFVVLYQLVQGTTHMVSYDQWQCV